MPVANPEAFAFLASRQSFPAKVITAPVPSRAELNRILAAATRVPDHGKLEPWKILVLERAALDRIAAATTARLISLGKDGDAAAKAAALFAGAPLIVAIISAPVASEKIPALEQTFSAGALCFGVLNAALASGWAATWQSGPVATDSVFLQSNLALLPEEYVAGFVVIGTSENTPPDRPRPDLDRKVSWVSA